MLYLPTSVGLQYGHSNTWLEGFLGSLEKVTSGTCPLGISSRGICPQAFNSQTLYHLARAQPSARRPDLLRHSIAHNGFEWGRNLNRLSIAYVFRPRLRSRLTLGGQPFPRKPWVFGGEDSHFSLRYLYLHSHFPYLHRSSRYGFTGHGNAPLPR
jgi:hypothetical protein